MASLLVIEGPNQNTRIPLERDRIVLGRDSACDVVINVPTVSSEHAHIIRKAGQYYIEDLKSRDGTQVNGTTIATQTPVPLTENDKIKICDFICSFHEPERKPLPKELLATEVLTDEEDDTVEASVSHSSGLLLDSQSTERLQALREFSGKLSNTLEFDQLLAEIVDRLFKLFKQADRGFVILREEPSGRLVPRVIKTRQTEDASNARFSRSIVRHCWEKVEGLLSDDAATDSRFSLAQSIAAFRIRSVMCAPLLTADGKAFGVIQLDTQDRAKKFAEEDLALLLGVANQASIALQNAKLHEDQMAQVRPKHDLELAPQVQNSLLPRNPPEPAFRSPARVRWERAAAELREHRERQRQTWGDLDEVALGRYLADEATSEERLRVDTALKQYPELHNLVEKAREILHQSDFGKES
jgi:pSer/pThr/pTyr-binding forkhead associated (FHA) protein